MEEREQYLGRNQVTMSCVSRNNRSTWIVRESRDGLVMDHFDPVLYSSACRTLLGIKY